MRTLATRTLNDALQQHADEYADEIGEEDFPIAELAEWAVRTGRYEPPRDLVMRKCREDYSRAMREYYVNDPDGQPVRVKHARRVTRGEKQTYLWADIRTASREKIEACFRQRREQVVGECRQLDRDCRYWNGINPQEKAIQLVFDFSDDVEEGRFSGEFRAPKKPKPR